MSRHSALAGAAAGCLAAALTIPAVAPAAASPDDVRAGVVNARYVRVAQTGTASAWWSVSDLRLYR
jgi:hypothetical protein